jgi:hypothetical protein
MKNPHEELKSAIDEQALSGGNMGGAVRVGGELLQIEKRAGRPKDLAGIPYMEAAIAELSRKT